MIAEILHKVAGMGNDDHHAYRPRPSLAGPERCMRQMVYQRIDQEPDRKISDRLIHVLNDSSWHEELTGDWLGKTAYDLHSRQMGVTLPGACQWLDGPMFRCNTCNEIIHPSHLHGHIDGILTDPLLCDRLYEHKALSYFTFEALWRQTEYPEDYFVQVAIYIRALHATLPDLREAILLVKNKNTSGFLEYLLRYDYAVDCLTIVSMTRHTGECIELNMERPSIVITALDKFANVESHAVAKTLPPRPYDANHWRCNYCPFKETCWTGYLEELTSLASHADLEPEEADTLRYYMQLGAEIREQERERDTIKQKILELLAQAQAKQGRAGEYTVSLVTQERETIDWERVPWSLQSAIHAYTRKTVSVWPKVIKLNGQKESGT